MESNRLKQAVLDIRIPENMKTRVIYTAKNKSTLKASKPAAVWRKPAAALLAATLCLAFAVPVLAATVEPFYELMYLVSPSAAQLFQPVRKSAVDNGVKMEVVSAYIHGDTAEVYITMQDLDGGRIDETTDLFDSYSLHLPFDSTGHCEFVSYDKETKTASFLISISNINGEAVAGDKITFSVRQFLSRKAEYLGVEIPVDLAFVAAAGQTQSVQPNGGGPGRVPDSFEAIASGAPDDAFPVDGIDLTGVAFVGGRLHIQSAVRDPLSNDNHGYFYLEDADGNRVDCDAAYFFTEEVSGERIDYAEYVFSVTPEALAEYSLCGDFWISGLLTQGNWRVTFPLEQAQ